MKPPCLLTNSHRRIAYSAKTQDLPYPQLSLSMQDRCGYGRSQRGEGEQNSGRAREGHHHLDPERSLVHSAYGRNTRRVPIPLELRASR